MFAAYYLLPIITALCYGETGELQVFAECAGIALAAGLALLLTTRRHRCELRPRDGYLLVSLSWNAITLLAALPLMLGEPHLSFTDAIFESMSGLSTTGSTIITGLDNLPYSVNLWRCALHWLGGMGIIVLAVAILPLLGVGGMQLYKAETPGPVKDEKLTPRITETAKSLWVVYTVMTLVGIGALRMAGMTWFDAICHGMSALSLGGFSTHDNSLGYYNSPTIEVVLSILMVAASLNFARHFVALRRLTLKPYRNDPEARAIVGLLAISIVVVTTLLYVDNIYPFFTALRHASFNVISMATTTGFVTEDFEKWPVFIPIWMLFLTCITCSTGSTGGGVKMFRTLLLSRKAGRELKLLVHPSAVWPVRIGGKPVPERVGDSVLAFIFLYFMTVVTLTFAMLLTGLDFDSSFSAIVASINNAGPGLAAVGPVHNFQSLTDLQTWICTAAMLVGRLEIFSVLVLFTPAFWRK